MKKAAKFLLVGLILLLLFVAICVISVRLRKKQSINNSNSKNSIFNNKHNNRSEFQIYPNGLIYSQTTMKKLNRIVDSLNLKFRKCELIRDINSTSQTVGYVVKLEKRRVKQAMLDMQNQMPIADFMLKYRKAKIKKHVLIIKNRYVDEANKEFVSVNYIDFQGFNSFSIESDEDNFFNKDLQNKWLFQYNEKQEYSEEYIEAFYFPNKFKSILLPAKYTEMINYTNCLLSPEATINNRVMNDSLISLPVNWELKSNNEKLILLNRLRSTRVVGACGFDPCPRLHAIAIAKIAAETASWNVFLLAHLNIINDRFSRNSDNSNANQNRGTYIKELEELDINVPQLLLGSVFRIDKRQRENYNATINRTGLALSETKNRKQVEKKILEIVYDPRVDDFNRVLFYLLFLNYNEYSKRININYENDKKLDAAFNQLPEYLKQELIYKKE